MASLASTVSLRPATFVATRPATRAPVSRARTVLVAAERKLWYPGAKAPEYLDGSLPGDRGFDPLRLSANPNWRPWLVEAEKTNGRWAMAAVAGILFTELVGIGPWWAEGAQVDLPLPLNVLIGIEVAVFAFVEYKRYEGWKKTGGSGFLNMFPFDPMGMNSDVNAEKEIKNGRLAMLAFLGFSSQAAVNGGKGPIECLKLHLDDPGHNNIYTSKVGPEFLAAVILLSAWPMYIEGRNALSNRDSNSEEFNPVPW